jgi:hypothetical protein
MEAVIRQMLERGRVKIATQFLSASVVDTLVAEEQARVRAVRWNVVGRLTKAALGPYAQYFGIPSAQAAELDGPRVELRTHPGRFFPVAFVAVRLLRDERGDLAFDRAGGLYRVPHFDAAAGDEPARVYMSEDATNDFEEALAYAELVQREYDRQVGSRQKPTA